MESLDKELSDSREAALLETQLSSLVWICTSTQTASIITVIDANKPAEILNSFGVCTTHMLCIASVPGASISDYENVTVQSDLTKENANEENTKGSDNNLDKEAVNNEDSAKSTVVNK